MLLFSHPTALKMHLVNNIFKKCVGRNHTRKNLFKTNPHRSRQGSSQTLLTNAINQRTNIVGTVILHVWLGAIRVTDFSDVLRSLLIQIFLETSFIGNMMEYILSTKQKIVRIVLDRYRYMESTIYQKNGATDITGTKMSWLKRRKS